MSEALEIQQSPVIDIPRRDNTFLVARNQMELQAAQARMVSWFSEQIQRLEADEKELIEAIDIALRNRWRRGTMQKHLKYTQDKILFFEKCKSAAAEGYAIIPDMPCNIFAIRVDPDNGVQEDYEKAGNPRYTGLPQQPCDQLAEGEGEYKSPEPKFAQGSYQQNNAKGEAITTYWRRAESFDAVTFPIIAAKPAIMTATKEAMAKRLFDEIAVAPRGRQKRRDPMILGRIVGPKKSACDDNNKLTFVICWFLDLETLR